MASPDHVALLPVELYGFRKGFRCLGLPVDGDEHLGEVDEHVGMEVDEVRRLHQTESLPRECLGSVSRTLGGERSGAHASPSDLGLEIV